MNINSNILRVFQKLFAFLNKLKHKVAFALKLAERFLLSLNQFFYIFNARRSNVSGGAEHDTVQEFNVGFQLITIGITFPVEINFDLSCENSGDKVFVFSNEIIKPVVLSSPLFL